MIQGCCDPLVLFQLQKYYVLKIGQLQCILKKVQDNQNNPKSVLCESQKMKSITDDEKK